MNHKNSLRFLSLIFTAAVLGACQGTRSVDLVVAPPTESEPAQAHVEQTKMGWVHINGGQRQLEFNPQIDILFVVDDSDSMTSHQENLARNFDQFMSGIQKNKMIDYHIGVTSVWDSSQRYHDSREATHAAKGTTLFANGELRSVKNANGSVLADKFIMRSKNSQSLASTIHIGITPYAEGGPEIEEMFSPISAALNLSGHGGANDGFFRPDAHLAVVVVSDADDNSHSPEITPDQLAHQLSEFKQGHDNLVSTWGVLVNKNNRDDQKDWDLRRVLRYHPECFSTTSVMDKKGQTKKSVSKTPDLCPVGFGPDRLENFIVLSNQGDGTPSEIKASHIMDINQNDFGKDLLRIGGEITAKVLAKEIVLDQVPRMNTNGTYSIRVFYGTEDAIATGAAQAIPNSAANGWTYDPEHNSIHISGNVQYKIKDGARFDVMIIPLNAKL